MLRLTTLGAVDLRDRLGHPVRDVLVQPKRVALLVYLVVESRRGPIPRDRLFALFWPESDAEHARNALSQSLHQLRQSLGSDSIENVGASAVQVPAAGLWCDAVAFAEFLERGEGDLALDLYRGLFCPDLSFSASPELEQWLDSERRRLAGLALRAARALAERLLGRADGPGAARLARRALDMRPDDEEDVRALLSVLESAGDAGGAVRAFDDYARRLKTELDAEPEPATARLAEAIRARREAAALSQADETPAVMLAAPGPAPAVLRPAPIRRRAALAAVLLLATIGAIAFARTGRHTPSPPLRTVAVLPFSHRGEATSAFLAEGMTDLLAAKLGGAAGIRALDPRAVVAAATSREPGAEASARIARGLGATWYITGEVIAIAGQIQLIGALRATGGGIEPLATASVTGDTTELFTMVDELARRLLADLAPGRDTAVTRLAAHTTTSLPALRAFLEGEQALRAGRDAEAASAFSHALQLDTTFALARYRLALTTTWVSLPDHPNPIVLAEEAARQAHRLTGTGRDLVAAYSAYKEVRADDAERMYRALTAGYPDHVEAWLMLGETYFHYNPFRGRAAADARAPFERALALEPGNVHALVHLARLAAHEGRVDDLDSLLERLGARYPDAERALEMRALRAFARDDSLELAQVTRAARAADDLLVYNVLEGGIILAQNTAAASTVARNLASRFAPRATDSFLVVIIRMLVSALGVIGGQWDHDPAEQILGSGLHQDWRLELQVLLAAEPLLGVPEDRIRALRDSVRARRPYRVIAHPMRLADALTGAQVQAYLDGLLSLRLGDRAAADAAERVLADQRAGPQPEAVMLLHALRAEKARSSGDPRRALAELNQFGDFPAGGRLRMPTFWGMRERFLRAEALLASGRDDLAATLYDSYLSFYDASFMAPAHLRRAEIHARAGAVPDARFHYGRFLSLWRDSDPMFRPLVERAEAALAALPATSHSTR